MKVMKFGGTSVGSAQRMKNVAQLIHDNNRNLVVLSAMSGTTNSLIEISDYYAKGNKESASAVVNILRNLYTKHIGELYATEQKKKEMSDFMETVFHEIMLLGAEPYTDNIGKAIVAKGEIMSTHMVTAYLEECGIKAQLLSAFDFMRTDQEGQPDMKYLHDALIPLIDSNPDAEIFITQGFICLNHEGHIDNLQRGGSDYTASLIGAAIRAEEIQIWTDIDGMHNNDPRFVDNTRPVPQLSFEEAAELAYFGAKILHPTCVLPAKFAGVPVKLLNTMEPQAKGTIINNQLSEENKIKAIAAKDNITAVKIVSSRMLLATGFLRKVFEIFETFHTSIDMVTTSEVGISMSIDNTDNLSKIAEELRKYGTVEIDRNMCIICVVGDLRMQNTGIESLVTDALKDIPIRMISYGGSEHNISFLIHEADKQKALQALSNKIF
ncbi:MAG: aspartate kinase [Bacteroidaceae bacterium]|nr:aspartate kinase [Bacteroidaceae bacterium]